MSAYTQPIIRFGLVTPAALNLLIFAGVFTAVNKLEQVRLQKEEIYREHTMRQGAIRKLENENAPKRPVYGDQKRLLGSDPVQLFTRLLDSILPKYKEIELERSSLVFPLDRGRVAKEAKTEVARVKTSFTGGYGPMQETFYQVESLMPQAVLEDIKITRKTHVLTQREHLLIEATHTCWKAGEEAAK
jgi:hypothetical protein